MQNISERCKYLYTLAILFTISIGTVLADDPTDPGGGPTGSPVGGDVPLDNGDIVFLVLAVLVGATMLIFLNKKLNKVNN